MPPPQRRLRCWEKTRAAGGVGGEKVFGDDLKDTKNVSPPDTLDRRGAVRSQIALPDACMLSGHTRVTFNLYQGSENLVNGKRSGLPLHFQSSESKAVLRCCELPPKSQQSLEFALVRAAAVVAIQVDWPFKTGNPDPYYWDTCWSVV